MINLLKLIFNKNNNHEKPLNQELKTPRYDYNRFEKKHAKVYFKKNFLYFQSGAQSDDLSETSGDNLSFKVDKNSTPEKKGKAIIKILDAYIINKSSETDLKIIKETGITKSEKLLIEISGSKDIRQFFAKTKLCGISIKKNSDTITFIPYIKGKGRGYRDYSGNSMSRIFEASKHDLETLGNTLDEALEYCFA